MLVSSAIALLATLPAFVSAGLFREGGPVKLLSNKNFKSTLKAEKTGVVVFYAPWCGHCKNLTPEFTRAAQSLSPLVDFYAIDCDASENKQICAEQGIQGFPTIKSFPLGTKGAPHTYNGERTASSIVNWASSEVPSKVTPLKGTDAIPKWAAKDTSRPRALLLTAQAKVPVMWKVLASRLYKSVEFGAAKDADGQLASSLNLPSSEDGKSRVVYWAPGKNEPTLYDGKLKFEPLTEYFEELAALRVKAEL